VAVGLASKRAPSKRRSQTPSQSLLNASPRLCDQDEVAGLSEVPVVPQAVKLMRDAAEQFFAADVDNSGSLTMDEFRRLVVPTTTPLTDDEVTILFERCDLDGSGTISLDEFFMFLLGYVQSQTGVGLDAIFRRYDQKGTDGTLDAAEFQHAAEDLGFGAISHDLFAELDPSGSGTVDGSELLSALKLRGASREAKRFILGLSYEAEHAAVVLDTRAWQLTTESYEALRLQLGALLAAHEPPARPGRNAAIAYKHLERAQEHAGYGDKDRRERHEGRARRFARRALRESTPGAGHYNWPSRGACSNASVEVGPIFIRRVIRACACHVSACECAIGATCASCDRHATRRSIVPAIMARDIAGRAFSL
jgi:Ca2+-binding EF-hand superfamily protein